MSEPIIEVKGISKAYKISHQLQRNTHPTIKDDIVHMARKPLSILGASGGVNKETLWALKDINFKVDQGDVVGIMGRNGSGKSTLFKILSQITHPTDGTAILNGRTASLLEVGTGFHPELTGRENVYFNGAVLGMRKKEIDKKFDDIVAFSEVEKFLDTPVKFYSSGMKVRLAFSVAAFLSSEILIIDEVLAVGDVRFKKKSLDHMKNIADNDGRTILFVSHIISKIEKICTRGLVLNNGSLVLDGELDAAIEKYLELNDTDEDVGDDSIGVTSGRESIFGKEVGYSNLQIIPKNNTGNTPSLDISLELLNLKGAKHDNMRLTLMIVDQMGKNIALIRSDMVNKKISISEKDKKKRITVQIPNISLVPDKYSLNISLKDDGKEKVYFKDFNADNFSIPDYEAFGMKMARSRGGQPPLFIPFKIKQ